MKSIGYTHARYEGPPHPPVHVHAICRSIFIFIVFRMGKFCNSLSRIGWALKKPLMMTLGLTVYITSAGSTALYRPDSILSTPKINY